MNRPSAGSIWMNSTARTKDRRPRNLKRLMARAARKARTSTTATTVRVIARLIRSAEPKPELETTLEKFDQVAWVGRKFGGTWRRRAFGVKANRTIQ